MARWGEGGTGTERWRTGIRGALPLSMPVGICLLWVSVCGSCSNSWDNNDPPGPSDDDAEWLPDNLGRPDLEWNPGDPPLEGYEIITAGTFTMGCSPGDNQCCRTDCWWPFDIEKPHEVIITRDFWMQKTEVTQGELFALTGRAPTVFTGCGDDCPVDGLTWWQMAAYTTLVSQAEGLTPCYYTDEAGTVPYDMGAGDSRAWPYWVEGLDCEGYRLPTEAEWEYAARAGTTTPLFTGEATDPNLDPIGWYWLNSQCDYAGCELENCRDGAGGIPPSGPQPVASKLPNDWGVYDTAGNLWEFVWDVFGEYHDGPVEDPTGPVGNSGGFHVARGGSWLNSPVEARASTRDGNDCTCDPDNGPGPHTGFRMARTYSP